jgi:carbonic anhydrase/acetyltransferase-like protein (isoleucine patch superfamily)
MIRPCPLTGVHPQIDPSAYVDPSALVIGQVRLGPRASIWPHSVVRGDVHTIEIGAETNIQDLCCLHVTRGRFPLWIGDRVTVGHSVTLHGCRVHDCVLVGIGAIILDGAEIGAESLVGAGALVTPGTKIPPRSLVLGSPARVKRALDGEELALVQRTWEHYVEYARAYQAALGRPGPSGPSGPSP